MSTMPTTARQADHRLLYFGGATFFIASTFLGLAVWTDNSVFGYPAFVAGLFCIVSLGIVFPAINQAVQGFLALLMWTGLWMMATTGPIALFLALSHWMLDQLPLALQIAVLLLWGALLTAAISLITTETSPTRLYTALRPIGALAPLVYTFNVLWIAMYFFALATCLLAGPDATVLAMPNSDAVSQAKLAERQARFSYLLDFFLC